MEIGAAGATSSYQYQASVQSGTQSQAVLQALTKAYTSASSANSTLDPITAMVGSVNLRPLVSAIYDQYQTTKAGTTAAVPGLSAAPTVGGLNSSSADALLATLASSSSASGFEAALGSSSYQALAAYQAQQASAAAPSASEAPSATSDSAAVKAYVQQIQQAFQTTTFNLLG